MRWILITSVCALSLFTAPNEAHAQGRGRCVGNGVMTLSGLVPLVTVATTPIRFRSKPNFERTMLVLGFTAVSLIPATFGVIAGAVVRERHGGELSAHEVWLRARCRTRFTMTTGTLILSAGVATLISSIVQDNRDQFFVSVGLMLAGAGLLAIGIARRRRLGSEPSSAEATLNAATLSSAMLLSTPEIRF